MTPNKKGHPVKSEREFFLDALMFIRATADAINVRSANDKHLVQTIVNTVDWYSNPENFNDATQ